MAKLYAQHVLKKQPTLQIQGLGGKKKQKSSRCCTSRRSKWETLDFRLQALGLWSWRACSKRCRPFSFKLTPLSFPVWISICPVRVHPHLVFQLLVYAVAGVTYWRRRRALGDHVSTEARWALAAAAVVGAVLGSRTPLLVGKTRSARLRNSPTLIIWLVARESVGGLTRRMDLVSNGKSDESGLSSRLAIFLLFRNRIGCRSWTNWAAS